MTVRRAKSVETLYDECEAYDLVVVPDAPLARALNRRLTRARLGPLATAPRRLAAGRFRERDDRTLFLEVVGRTDLPWKHASYLVDAVLSCWESEGSADAILGYEGFDDAATRTVVEHLRHADSRHRELDAYEIDGERSVAVIAPDILTELEQLVLPETYDEISPFADGAFDQPPFRLFESSAAIVDALLDAVTTENADDVAVVMNEGSTFPALVESGFEAADIPFYGGPGFADDPHHRTFLGLLRASFAGSDLLIRDAQSVLAGLGARVAVEHDEKRLATVGLPAVEEFRSFQSALGEHTFGSALEWFEARAGVSLDRFATELETLGVADASVTEHRVEELAFYLQHYEVPVEREDEGVLLAAAKSAAYVDRPVVFYLGLDEDWTYSPAPWPWIDGEREFDRHLRQFQLLVQNGIDQYYLVQDEAGGRPVTPCLYFDELFDEPFERFGDLDSVAQARTYDHRSDGFARESLDVVVPRTTETISQSALNTYANCPRDYFFGRVVDSPDKIYFREGNLFHDFAEFYVNHPDHVDADAIDEAVTLMVEEVSSFVPVVALPVRETRYRLGVETIVEYLDANPPDADAFLTPDSGWGRNVFAERFDRDVDSPTTECWFENPDLRVKGKIDLIHGPNRLLDYKSGRKKSAYSVVKHSSLDPVTDEPNFQALCYLAHLRSERPGVRLEFTFFHFLETLDDVVTGDATIEDTLTTVTYHPTSFDEYVASRDAFEVLCDGYSDCRETFTDLGFEHYHEIVRRRSFPETTDRSELRASLFAEGFTADVVSAVSAGVDADAEKGCDQAIRALDDVRQRNFFDEDLDAFEAFVEERLVELNRYRAGEERFPVGEPNLDRVDNRDLVLIDDGADR